MPKRILPCLLLISCTGTDSGNPPVVIDDFGNSECKIMRDGATAPARSPLFSRAALPSNDALSGLYCVRYRRGEGTKLRLEYINFGASCHADGGWFAGVEEAEGADLAVSLTCTGPTAGCGSCIYDLRYELDVADLASARTISLMRHECWGGEDVRTDALTFADGDEGLSCHYTFVHAERWVAESENTSGRLRRPCRDSSSRREETLPSCDGELVCTEVADGDPRCLAPCAQDTDCELTGVEACVDGLCRLP